jgi:alpha-tubulin suppressor-like RCC1 family protein
MTSKAWGQFKSGFSSLTGNYLYMWGENGGNQLGQYMTGSLASRSSPVQIGTRSYAMVSAGKATSSAMAVDSGGRLWGWGANPSGMLGDSSTITRSSPVQIGTLTNWATVTVGTTASGAVKTDGTLWTWGIGTSGQLGNGTTTAISSPVQVGTLTTWSKISAGTTWMLALATDGTMWAWGLQTGGRLGNGTTTAVGLSSPVQIGTLTTWTAISAAAANGFGVAGAALYSWGTAGAIIGNGTSTIKSVPTQIGTLTTWSSVGAGDSHAGAIKTDGTLWMWGTGTSGQLGNGAALTTSSPVQVGTLTGWSAIATGSAQSMSTRTDGTLYGWGTNSSGQLGLNTATATYSSPVQVGTLTGWTAPSTSGTFSSMLNGNRLFTVGTGVAQLGQAAAFNTSPVAVGLGTTKFANVAGGLSYAIAVATNRALYGWGDNTLGQMGSGTTSAVADGSSYPVQIGTQTDWSTPYPYLNTVHATKGTNTLWAWGDNTSGQLGVGALSAYTVVGYPQQFGGTYGTVANAVSDAGITATRNANSVLYVTTGGALFASGDNTNGQLGQGNTTTYVSPVQVGTLTNWSKVILTNETSVALKTDGSLWAWGNNDYGQLGQGDTTNRSSPIQVGTLTTWANIEGAGGSTWYATKTDGTMWSCGDNTSGALGIGYMSSASNSGVFQQVGQYTATNAAIGGSGTSPYYSNYIIRPDGSLWSWSDNSSGQLGLGDTTNRSSPVQIGTLTTWSTIAAGQKFAIARKTDNTLWGWGLGEQGQLGSGGFINANVTANISPLTAIATTGFSKIANSSSGDGGYYAGGVKTNGTLWVWGQNPNGQLGTNDVVYRSFPVQLGTQTDWAFFTAGAVSSFAIKTGGTLYAWGQNNYGSLGDGTTNATSSPIQIGTLSNWAMVGVSNGYVNSGAIKTDGTLWTWGCNLNGALGTTQNAGTTTGVSSPVQVGTLSNWATIALSNNGAVLATKTDGTLWAWGYNGYGQFGDSTLTSKSSPIQIGTLTNWATVTAGSSSTMAVKTDGTLWAWGQNTGGQLGTGSTNAVSSPVQIGGGTTWSKVSMGSLYALATKVDGTAWAWGRGTDYQLGTGTNTNYSSPVQVGTTVGFWSDVKAQDISSWFLDSQGNIYACGYNTQSALGVSPLSSSSPIQIGTNTWLSASAGESFVNAVRSDGTLWGWGTSSSGALGNPTYLSSAVAIQSGTQTVWSSVSSGFNFALGRQTTGKLYAWGGNGNGQLGIGNTITQSFPVQIGTLTNWLAINSGSYASSTMAVKSDGTMWAWGRNNNYELGLGDASTRSSPVQVGTLTNWSYANAGYVSALATNTSNELYGMGFFPGSVTYQTPTQIGASTNFAGYTKGIPGNNNTVINDLAIGTNTYVYALNQPTLSLASVSSPVQVGTLTTWTKPFFISNQFYVWGSNSLGQLGLNIAETGVAAPTRFGGSNTYTSASIWSGLLSAVKSDGTLYTSGNNSNGQLGTGTDPVGTPSTSSPVQVGTLTNWSSTTPNNIINFFTNTSNQVYAAGGGFFTGVGNSTEVSSPVQVTTTGFTPSTVYRGCLMTSTANTLYGWGSSYSMVVATNPATPTQVTGLRTWASRNVRSDGTLWTWGANNIGQLGLGDTLDRWGPTQVGTLTNWSKVSFGGVGATTAWNVAVKTNGTLWAWGWNSVGQLGDGTTVDKSSPVQIGTLTNWLNISCGASHTVAIKTDGTMWAWGQNNLGQLGVGNLVGRSSPTQIGTLTTWYAASAYDAFSAATKTDGTLWTWGYATLGRLGNGTTTPNLSNPAQIGTLTTWVIPEANSSGTFGGALRSN